MIAAPADADKVIVTMLNMYDADQARAASQLSPPLLPFSSSRSSFSQISSPCQARCFWRSSFCFARFIEAPTGVRRLDPVMSRDGGPYAADPGTRVFVRGTLHRCAKDGAWSNRFSPPSCRARARTRGNAKLVPPEYVVLFSGISHGNV